MRPSYLYNGIPYITGQVASLYWNDHLNSLYISPQISPQLEQAQPMYTRCLYVYS